MNPGIVVHCRERDWVLMPSEDQEVYVLRPLTGTSDFVVKVHKQLAQILGCALREEMVRPSQFPLPSPDDVSNAVGAHLLWQAVRLTLREGATPLRSLGRISVRPRTYQFVPLLMALRLDPVRLFIADDVGVGKTIEALLVARELIDRGEVRRLAVLCPPYLCDQWQRELREKFNLQAVVIRSSTVGQLERLKPHDQVIYEHYPIQVISIDWVKSDRHRSQFLEFCPELVIVDEAHGVADVGKANHSEQQQRHRLVRELAQQENRHLILLTATPHSGIPEAFASLLGLLRPEFGRWDFSAMSAAQRDELAKHFIQRTRRDIEEQWEKDRCFPERQTVDETYTLSPLYRELFEKTYDFCRQLIASGQQLNQWTRRVRNWAALALLRCVMSSPAAACASLRNRAVDQAPPGDEQAEPAEELTYQSLIFESSQDVTDDESPTPPIERTEAGLAEADRRKLRELQQLAERLENSPQDTKLEGCKSVIRRLLKEKFHPIVWCRYVATADYVGQSLRTMLGDEARVIVITGRLGDDERRAIIDEIDVTQPRVLVATDCLSEGINLQEKFNAVIHYDLPWNPNRLEQREGRVDRFGQTSQVVKAIRFYGRDNPVDGAVIEVLLNKAREIHRTLGTYVPIPQEEATIMEAILNSLFIRRRDQDQQLWLFNENEELRLLRVRWDEEAQRERVNRTRFAQRAIKPEEVQRELEATDSVLGDPEAVRQFVQNAAQQLRLQVKPRGSRPTTYAINVSPAATFDLPDAIQLELPTRKDGWWIISFDSPTPEGAEYVGRNHRFVTALARYLLEDALTKKGQAVAARCGAIRTQSVNVLTTLLLLRVRYLLRIPEQSPQLAEEVLIMGYRPHSLGGDPWLEDGEALRLLVQAQPQANISLEEKRELVAAALGELEPWNSDSPWGERHAIQRVIRSKILQRSRDLQESHKRLRKALAQSVRQLAVEPQFPPDLLGLLILQPMVKR